MQMYLPVVGRCPNSTTLYIPLMTKVDKSPSSIEACRECLKETLKKYVSYRLQRHDEVATTANWQQKMRGTDMFDTKNIHKSRKLALGLSMVEK
jgi:hypothetical protein